MKPLVRSTVNGTLGSVIARVDSALAEVGFRVRPTVNLREPLRSELQEMEGEYRVLGACNPVCAGRAREAGVGFDVILPCNILLREFPVNRTVEVIATDPLRRATAEERERLLPFVEDVIGNVVEAIQKLSPRVDR